MRSSPPLISYRPSLESRTSLCIFTMVAPFLSSLSPTYFFNRHFISQTRSTYISTFHFLRILCVSHDVRNHIESVCLIYVSNVEDYSIDPRFLSCFLHVRERASRRRGDWREFRANSFSPSSCFIRESFVHSSRAFVKSASSTYIRSFERDSLFFRAFSHVKEERERELVNNLSSSGPTRE